MTITTRERRTLADRRAPLKPGALLPVCECPEGPQGHHLPTCGERRVGDRRETDQ